MICSMSIKQKFNIFEEKMYDNLVILIDFCGNFPLFWLIFCYPDPFPDKRIRIRNTKFYSLNHT